MHVLNIFTTKAKIKQNTGSDYCNQVTTMGRHTKTTIQENNSVFRVVPQTSTRTPIIIDQKSIHIRYNEININSTVYNYRKRIK